MIDEDESTDPSISDIITERLKRLYDVGRPHIEG